GGVFIAGDTKGSLGGRWVHHYDAFVAKFTDDPPAPLKGDFSGDGLIDNADLTLLLNYWGDPATPTPAAWTGHLPTAPAVDNSELTALLNAWGQGANGSGAYGAVPEPTTLALLFLGTLTMIGAGRIQFL